MISKILTPERPAEADGYRDANGVMPLHCFEFTVAEYARAFETDVPLNKNLKYAFAGDPAHRGEIGGYGPGSDWYAGLESIEEARDLVLCGWKDGAKRIGKFAAKLAKDLPDPVSIRRRPAWADDGADLDIDRALAGEWNTAYRHCAKRASTGPQVIDVVAPFGGNCGCSGDELFWSGAAALALTSILEDAGYSVALRGIAFVQHLINGRGAWIVNMKDAGEALRPDAVAGIMAHAGTYRTLGFRSFVLGDLLVDSGLGSHGKSEFAYDIMRQAGELPAAALTLPDCYSEHDALAAVRAQLDLLQKATE